MKKAVVRMTVINIVLIALLMAICAMDRYFEGQSALGCTKSSDSLVGQRLETLLRRTPVFPDEIQSYPVSNSYVTLIYDADKVHCRVYPRREIVVSDGMVISCR